MVILASRRPIRLRSPVHGPPDLGGWPYASRRTCEGNGLAGVLRGEPFFVFRQRQSFESEAMRSIVDSDPDLAVFLRLRLQEIFRRLQSQGWDDGDIGLVLDELVSRYDRQSEPGDMRLRLTM